MHLSGREKTMLSRIAILVEAMGDVDLIKVTTLITSNCERCIMTKTCDSCAINRVLHKIMVKQPDVIADE